ncbi:MAG: hypothetical protein OXC62_17455 [Aestuariivita sp.]|nr:hypothetical protein [Aestuariivita sp.]
MKPYALRCCNDPFFTNSASLIWEYMGKYGKASIFFIKLLFSFKKEFILTWHLKKNTIYNKKKISYTKYRKKNNLKKFHKIPKFLIFLLLKNK